MFLMQDFWFRNVMYMYGKECAKLEMEGAQFFWIRAPLKHTCLVPEGWFFLFTHDLP